VPHLRQPVEAVISVSARVPVRPDFFQSVPPFDSEAVPPELAVP
jgi:hypothetical protein